MIKKININNKEYFMIDIKEECSLEEAYLESQRIIDIAKKFRNDIVPSIISSGNSAAQPAAQPAAHSPNKYIRTTKKNIQWTPELEKELIDNWVDKPKEQREKILAKFRINAINAYNKVLKIKKNGFSKPKPIKQTIIKSNPGFSKRPARYDLWETKEKVLDICKIMLSKTSLEEKNNQLAKYNTNYFDLKTRGFIGAARAKYHYTPQEVGLDKFDGRGRVKGTLNKVKEVL